MFIELPDIFLNQCRFGWKKFFNAFDKALSLVTTNIIGKMGGRLLGNISMYF